MTCSCGSGKALADCCEPYLTGAAVPETAEALMRSRYTAYTLRNIGYLARTQETDQPFDAVSAADWARQADWKRLDIVNTQAGQASDETGKVEFIAWYLLGEDLTCHNEVSDFRRRDGNWFYTHGEGKPEARAFAAYGRNDPCPCGSGRKFKKCHGG
ncbi:MAG: hypothetical protein CMK09_18995 [Ponticaulis sp.]|nr:hypothetical protein [Ponticaulis sp.]|tara:strand:- start:169323 stop:169793 length:471 start_codon:yes stop_codon:yes gene_type:complete